VSEAWWAPWREWTTRSVTLTSGEANALRSSELRFRLTERGGGLYEMATTRWVGVDTILGRQVAVHPKMDTGRLVYLLARGAKLPSFAGHAALGPESDILHALVEAYLVALDAALVQGPLSAYVEVREDLAALRGRIDIPRQYGQRFGLLPPVSCEFDDFTSDIEPNRRLLAAIDLLLAGTTKDTPPRLRLHASRLAQSVTRVRYAGTVEPLVLGRDVDARMGRTAPAYRTAVALAESILNHGFVRFVPGARRSMGFAVNMDNVYERFLFAALGEALGAPRLQWSKPVLRLLAGDHETHVPDMVWWNRLRRPRLVLDAKWMNKHRKKNVRKMLTYCTALGITKGVLVLGGGEERVDRVPLGNIEIYSWTLPVDGSIDELEARLDAFATRLKELAPGSP